MAFASSVGVEGTGADALAKLRALPALTIRGDLNFSSSRKTYSGPMIDGQDHPGRFSIHLSWRRRPESPAAAGRQQ